MFYAVKLLPSVTPFQCLSPLGKSRRLRYLASKWRLRLQAEHCRPPWPPQGQSQTSDLICGLSYLGLFSQPCYCRRYQKWSRCSLQFSALPKMVNPSFSTPHPDRSLLTYLMKQSKSPAKSPSVHEARAHKCETQTPFDNLKNRVCVGLSARGIFIHTNL